MRGARRRRRTSGGSCIAPRASSRRSRPTKRSSRCTWQRRCRIGSQPSATSRAPSTRGCRTGTGRRSRDR
eukprot:2327221-Pyramimonas_sp.AAC.1